MLEFKPLDSELNPSLRSPQTSPSQRRMMIVALSLLLITLAFVLYRDRDFWFPDAPQADDPLPQSAPVATTAPPVNSATPLVSASKSRVRGKRHKTPPPVAAAVEAPAPTEPVTVHRTVLPPLEVEVVAGASHRILQPGTNSVRVEMQQGSPAPARAPEIVGNETAANVTTNAADHAPLSPATAAVVDSSVPPDYPTLARQMKVQGSVILQALIARDGLIQDLRVVSGSPILAKAAQEAVRQWHFKPHYDGGAAVETQANITVNFTISTN